MRHTNELANARNAGIRLDADFHTLCSDQIERVLAAADAAKYRQPRNANGSRARYYHARLQRLANRSK